MASRLLDSLGQISTKASRSSGAITVEAKGARRGPRMDLAPYSSLEIHADLDASWRPGPPRARLWIRESLWRHLSIEQIDGVLHIASRASFEGERPILELSGPQLERVALGSRCALSLQDAHAPMFFATCADSSSLRAQGHARELHIECSGEASVDCASLVCEIAVAELSGHSFALVRAEAALQARARDACHLLTIGSPRILDVSRPPRRA
jgi:hypothetical protein